MQHTVQGTTVTDRLLTHGRRMTTATAGVILGQFALHFGTREFVMYNPGDQHAMTSHKMDRLQLTPPQLALEQSRGHYAVHDAPHLHWKYFWFD